MKVRKPISQNPQDVKILSLISRDINYNKAIAEQLDLKPNTTIKHLKFLEENEYIKSTRKKNFNKKIYSVNYRKIVEEFIKYVIKNVKKGMRYDKRPAFKGKEKEDQKNLEKIKELKKKGNIQENSILIWVFKRFFLDCRSRNIIPKTIQNIYEAFLFVIQSEEYGLEESIESLKWDIKYDVEESDITKEQVEKIQHNDDFKELIKLEEYIRNISSLENVLSKNWKDVRNVMFGHDNLEETLEKNIKDWREFIRKKEEKIRDKIKKD